MAEQSVRGWIEKLPVQGKAAFSLMQLQAAFPTYSTETLNQVVKRLGRQRRVLSIHKGYYLLIPAQYQVKGILPPALFVDGLMSHLKRPYYVGLLNAAALHGAAHQQPQEYFLFTTFPAMRPTAKRGLRIQYISKEVLPAEQFIESRKVETGYLRVSSPALTAADLVQYNRRIGGLDRAATVLAELADAIMEDAFPPLLLHSVPIAVWQRLGYLLEKVVEQPSLGGALYKACEQANIVFHRVALSPAHSIAGYTMNARWRVLPNVQVEADDL